MVEAESPGYARWPVKIVGHAMVDPRTLTVHPLNPKIHTSAQDQVVTASLERLGWVKSLTINTLTGHILDGHERVELAIRAGVTQVPVEYVEVPPEREGDALMTLDASAGLAQTHLEKWATLRRQSTTTDVRLQGFWQAFAGQAESESTAASHESAGVGGDGPVADEEDVHADLEATRQRVQADLQAQRDAWQTAAGQLWQVGEHYVWCGDSTGDEGWMRLADRVGQVRGCITSPPYAMQRAADYGGVPAEQYVRWFWPLAEQLYAALALDGSFFLNLKEHSEGIRRPTYVHELIYRLSTDAAWWYIDEFCWERVGVPGDPVTRGKFKNMWEPVFQLGKQARVVFHPERAMHRTGHALYGPGLPGLQYYQGTGKDYLKDGGREVGPGWAYAGNRLPTFSNAEAVGHVAAFPIGLPQFFVDVYSEPGDWWVDPFLGSGSTLLACARLQRQCFGMERDPRYVALTLTRWVEQGGDTPVVVGHTS